jgi:hypothetical protein
MAEKKVLEGKIEQADMDVSTNMMANVLGISLLRHGGELVIGQEDFRRMRAEGPFNISVTDGEVDGTLVARLVKDAS